MQAMDEKRDLSNYSRDGPSGTDSPPTCANCGAPISTNDWYPITTCRDDEGAPQVYSFCDTACRDAWLND